MREHSLRTLLFLFFLALLFITMIVIGVTWP